MDTTSAYPKFTLNSRVQARREFAELRHQGWYGQLWAKLSGRSHTLQDLHQIDTAQYLQSRSHAGVQLVSVAQIRGSEGRCQDFDLNFCPLKSLSEERWVSIAYAWQSDIPLPLVQLIQVDDTYYVRDGHHRISVARWLGQKEIEAEVTVWHCRPVPTITAVNRQAQRPGVGVIEWLTKRGEQLLSFLRKVQPLPQVSSS